MKSNILKQSIYEMRTQKMASSVTIIGTALSIFLIMMVLMIQQSETLPFAPESNRSRLLYGMNMNVVKEDQAWDSSSHISRKMAERLYGNLEGIDKTSYFVNDQMKIDAEQTGHAPTVVYMAKTDDKFWDIFDHTFLAGVPFDEAMVREEQHVVILSESAARRILGVSPAEAIGQTILLGQRPVRVTGVIKDCSQLATHAFAEAFIPIENNPPFDDEFFGETAVALLMAPGVEPEQIKKQVEGRYAELNTDLKPSGQKAIYREQPYTQKLSMASSGTNSTPDTSGKDRRTVTVIVLLLLVPAVNMSAMAQSRLKRRTAEMGIKRAYGATRGRLILELLAENMVLTLVGGAIGLLFSIAGAWILGDYVFSLRPASEQNLNVPFELLIQWQIFGYALAGCFLLNLLSAGIPAWRASHGNTVEALRS